MEKPTKPHPKKMKKKLDKILSLAYTYKMEVLIGIIVALLAGLFYSNTKRKSAEALLENNDAAKKLNQKDHSIEKEKAQLDAEEAKRKELEKVRQEKEGSDVSQKDLEDFFNDPAK